jgi:chromosome segregation ATPase
MTKNVGVGVFWVVSLFLVGGACFGESGSSATPDVEAQIDFKARAQDRIAALRDEPFETVQKAVKASELRMNALNEQAQSLRMEAREWQEKLRLENPEVRAMYQQIDAMRAKINQYIDELPEVKGKLDAATEAQNALLEEAWFRTAAMALAAELDRAAGFPDRPESILIQEPTGEPSQEGYL